MAYRKFTKYRGQIYQKFISNANFKYLLLCNLLENKIILLIVSFEKNRRQTSSNLLYSFKKKKKHNYLFQFSLQFSFPNFSTLNFSTHPVEKWTSFYVHDRIVHQTLSRRKRNSWLFLEIRSNPWRIFPNGWTTFPIDRPIFPAGTTLHPSRLFLSRVNRVDGARGAETRVSGRKARSQHTIRRRTRPVK